MNKKIYKRKKPHTLRDTIHTRYNKAFLRFQKVNQKLPNRHNKIITALEDLWSYYPNFQFFRLVNVILKNLDKPSYVADNITDSELLDVIRGTARKKYHAMKKPSIKFPVDPTSKV